MINGTDAELIGQTVNTQPIMLAAGVAAFTVPILKRAAKRLLSLPDTASANTSHPVAAGALDFADAVKLVRLRAELMQSAVPQGVGAMAAILGLEDEQVKAICAEAAQGEVVEAVNSFARQVVIAGNAAAVERAMNAAKEAGAKRALPLPVSVPSHCSLMKPAAEKLAEALKTVEIKQPKIRVIHNADVAAYDDAEKIKDALVRQLYSPVRWTETVNALVAEGITESAECGPGKVLAGLAKRINKEAVCSALTTLNKSLPLSKRIKLAAF